ncbi:MAG TPA: phage holin family protein [Verrucomicrobiae bacterium]|nr:phage holin family protein [Verrucomicrobiae bacterium]
MNESENDCLVETTEKSNAPGLSDASKRIAQRILVLVGNRFDLLMIELQEEREVIIRAICLLMAMAIFGLLACIAITAVIAAAFWKDSPVAALLALAGFYAIAGIICYILLLRLKRDWSFLPTTLEQLKKDRECLDKTFL